MAEGYEPIPYGGDNTKKTVISEIKVVTHNGTIPANASYVTVTANVPSGYTFLCWVESWSSGWIGLIYPSWPLSVTCDFWTTNTTDSDRSFGAIFFVYKTTTVSA